MDTKKRTTSAPVAPVWEVSFQISKGLDTAHLFFTVQAWSSEMATLKASRYMSDGLHKFVDGVMTKKRDVRTIAIK